MSLMCTGCAKSPDNSDTSCEHYALYMSCNFLLSWVTSNVSKFIAENHLLTE